MNIGNSVPVRTESAPHCTVCGSGGSYIYHDLRDRLFGAPGIWDLRRCLDRHCGTLWLDPRPAAGELDRLYANYYTHESSRSPQSRVGRTYRAVVAWHNYRQFGGVRPSTGILPRLGSPLLWLHPGRRVDAEARGMSLPVVEGGKALEIGFGSGETVEMLSAAGWRMEGIDFDESVVSRARARGLNVKAGTLEDARYPSNYFDAIAMSHVIEHLTDPLATLTECYRVLKPEGSLVLHTPNATSLGHRLFGRHWRGLEPPRHLQVFSIGSLAALALKAGFDLRRCTASGRGGHILYESLSLRLWGTVKRPPQLLVELAMTLGWLVAMIPGLGEEIQLIAAKPAER